MTTPLAAPATGAATVPGCPHVPPCPAATAVDHDAARVVLHDYVAGFSLLCSGVILFEDTGELIPDDGPTGCHAEPPHRPEPPHHKES